MPFGVVSGVDRGMGVLDGSGYRRREGAVLGLNLGHPIVTNGNFATRLFAGIGLNGVFACIFVFISYVKC